MAVLIKRGMSMLFSSESAAGAENVSADGCQFSVTLSSPLSIPKSAMNCSMAVIAATIWNTSPNIAASFGNNLFRYQTSIGGGGLVTYTEVIDDGLYSLDALNSYLAIKFQNRGFPGDLFVLTGNNATNEAIITFLQAGDILEIGIVGSVGVLLGWPLASPNIVAPVPGYSEFSPQTAVFNRVNSYIISSDIISTGISLNGTSRSILANVPITAPPGSQITYLPTCPQFFPADELIGNPKQFCRFQLTDQALRAAPTNGETYSVTLLIKWEVLLSSQPVPLKTL